MSAPAILLSTDGKSQEKVKVSAAQSLVRQLLAVELVAKKLYQRVEVKSAAILRTICRPFIPDKLPSHKTPGTKAKGPVVEQDQGRMGWVRQAGIYAFMHSKSQKSRQNTQTQTLETA